MLRRHFVANSSLFDEKEMNLYENWWPCRQVQCILHRRHKHRELLAEDGKLLLRHKVGYDKKQPHTT
jgi:hypothetical protein